MKNLIKALLLLVTVSIAGCSDYQITSAHRNTETVYVEVEVPVYIYEEVPGDTNYGEIWVDSFTQPLSVDGVDILWVIDTSGSMSRYDPQLLAGIEAMMNALPESGWRLAMLSNDPAKASIEAQFPLVPGDDIDDAMDMYTAMGRGHREEGFDAAYEYIMNNPYASTWMRPDAALLVVMVSDEEEQSDDHFPLVDDFLTWYSGQRAGSAFLSSINNVEAADSVCTHPVNSIDIGDRYMEATNYFGGVVVDICAEDWSPGVTDASAQIEPHESWELTHLPSHEDTIRVFQNGVLNWDWYYESSDNTVQFTIIPSGNVLVEIGYHYEPDPSTDTGDTGSN